MKLHHQFSQQNGKNIFLNDLAPIHQINNEGLPHSQSLQNLSGLSSLQITNPFVKKHDIYQTIKSVSITCDQEIVIFGTMRKILFRKVQSIFDLKQKLKESKMETLGHLSVASNREVSQIEVSPQYSQIIASVSGNNVHIWDLESPESQTETLSYYKQITSISWKNSDDKILATASQDNNLIIWDVKSCKQIQCVHQQIPSSNTNIVTWNLKDTNKFATALDKTVKLWDMRKFGSGCELLTQEIAGNSNIRSISFDPVFGSLLLTQDKNNVKLFRSLDMKLMDIYEQKKPILNSQFLPIRDYQSPGVIILPERSANFVYLQVEAGIPETKQNYQPLNNDLDSWNLRFQKLKSEQAGPQLDTMGMTQDIFSYAIRRDPQVQNEESYQILSVSSDSCLRILTLNKDFVKEFKENEIQCLSEQLNRTEEQIKIAVEQASVDDSEQDLTQHQRTKVEIEKFKLLSYVSGLTIEEVRKIDDVERIIDTFAVQLNVKMRLNVNNSFISIFIVLPPDYPAELPKFHIGESFMVNASTMTFLHNILKKITFAKSTKNFSLKKVLECAYYILSGDQNHKAVQNIYTFLGEEKQQNSVSLLISSESDLQTQKEERKNFIAYPRTCCFSWNCFNQIAYVASNKYNFELLQSKPELKKQFEWPAQRLYLTEQTHYGKSSFVQQQIDFLSETDDQIISQKSDSITMVQEVENEEISYYDDDEQSFENSEDGQDKPNQLPLDLIKLDVKKKSKVNPKELKSPYSKIYKVHLKLSKWNEPSAMVARLQTLCITQSPQEYCLENALRFAQSGLFSSSQVWQLLATSLDLTPEKTEIWAQHPLGKGLALNALSYFEQRKNLQQVSVVAALIIAKELQLYDQYETKKKLKSIRVQPIEQIVIPMNIYKKQAVSGFSQHIFQTEQKNKIQNKIRSNNSYQSLLQPANQLYPRENDMQIIYDGEQLESGSPQVRSLGSNPRSNLFLQNQSLTSPRHLPYDVDESEEEESNQIVDDKQTENTYQLSIANQVRQTFNARLQQTKQASNKSENQEDIKPMINRQSNLVLRPFTEFQQQKPENESFKSLVLQQDPVFSYNLILYLKWYSDRLYQWQETTKAIQISKLASRAYEILKELHPDRLTFQAVKYIARNLFGNVKADTIMKRDFCLQDFLLFSEHSLNYDICWQDYVNISEIETEMKKQKLKSQVAEPPMIKCAICHLTARGLVYTCAYCGHGGHYQHMQDWFGLCSNQTCPLGCGCTRCYISSSRIPPLQLNII